MSDKKPNIAQIRKYLNGELDARAMHQLERQLHEDPFLWDVVKGMELGGDGHQNNLAAIEQLINQRLQKDEKPIIPLWKIASAAAVLLIGLSIGGWFLTHQTIKPTIVLNEVKKPKPVDKVKGGEPSTMANPVIPAAKQPMLARLSHGKFPKTNLPANPYLAGRVGGAAANSAIKIKGDTTEYAATTYPVRANATTEDLLKKLPGVDVDAKGNVTAQGKQVTKVRLNGKDFFGGDVKTATQNLPADIVEKVQVIDDYGNQAAKTGIKNGDPNKVMNIAIRGNGTITGKVTDANGLPLPGADVKIKGTQTHTTTDKNGAFKITTPPLAELAISYIGFNTKEVIAKDSLNVTMNENGRSLAEVVVTGYGTAKKKETTGSVSSVALKDVTIKDTSIEHVLQGRVAGVQVMDKSKSQSIPKTITGTVTDKNGHSPIPGALITLSGKTVSTATNINGTFKLTVPTADDTLFVAVIGYKSQTIKLKGRTDLKIEMEPSANSLSEVVVTGYGTPTDKDDAYESPHPAGGWSAYNKYLKANAIMPDGKTGKVKLIFMVDAQGVISNIATSDGSNTDMTKKAVGLVTNGAKWVGASDGKATKVRLTIKFHK